MTTCEYFDIFFDYIDIAVQYTFMLRFSSLEASKKISKFVIRLNEMSGYLFKTPTLLSISSDYSSNYLCMKLSKL